MTRSSLEILQRRFVRSVSFLADPELVSAVTGAGQLTAEQAIDVYRQGYIARLTEALGETYEACWRMLGDKDFFAVCRDFIAQAPSTHYNLSDYGTSFPEYLAGHRDHQHSPFLGDLARFERSYMEVFHARPSLSLDAQVMAANVSPSSILRVSPSARLAAFSHRAYDLWKRNRSDNRPLDPSEWSGAQKILMYKKSENPIFVMELSAMEFEALSLLFQGQTIEGALSGVAGISADQVKNLFLMIAQAGIIEGIL